MCFEWNSEQYTRGKQGRERNKQWEKKDTSDKLEEEKGGGVGGCGGGCWSGAVTVMNPFRHRLKTGWNLNACQCETACACKVFCCIFLGEAHDVRLAREFQQELLMPPG